MRSHQRAGCVSARINYAYNSDRTGQFMNSYRIMKSKIGWALFKNGSVKPSAEAPTKEGLVKVTASLIAGKAASVKVHNENGSFQELRF
ncbi:DUF2188 domain-containing protein [Pseudomonas syringae]|uniref:DUF2188 domain-containing protein n=2 Tax=Pseudomonas TaxID=286 RepID=UPI003AF31B70